MSNEEIKPEEKEVVVPKVNVEENNVTIEQVGTSINELVKPGFISNPVNTVLQSCTRCKFFGENIDINSPCPFNKYSFDRGGFIQSYSKNWNVTNDFCSKIHLR